MARRRAVSPFQRHAEYARFISLRQTDPCLLLSLTHRRLSFETVIHNLDGGGFYTKWLNDFADTQVYDNRTMNSDGALPDCIVSGRARKRNAHLRTTLDRLFASRRSPSTATATPTATPAGALPHG